VPVKTKSAKLSASAAKLRLLKTLRCTLRYEKKAWASGARLVAGVDEVGRGSLFGAVVAGAVILDPTYRIRGLRDSKLLPRERREVLAERIREHAIAWAVAAVDAARIDQINIYQASRLAMRMAVSQLAPAADYLLIDALRLDCEQTQKALIHGDALSASIAAASILAKVERPHHQHMGSIFRCTGSRRIRGTALLGTWPRCASTDLPRCTGSRLRRCGMRPYRRKC
jgi:ribonuclease HII